MAPRVLIALAALLAVLVPAGTASAVKHKQCSIRAVEPCHINAMRRRTSVLAFPFTVHRAYTAQTTQKFVVEKFTEEVTIEPLDDADYGNIEIKVGDHKVGVFVTIVDSLDEHHGRVDFYDPLTDKRARNQVVEQDFDSHLASLILRGFGVVNNTRFAPDDSTEGLALDLQLVSLRLGNQVKLVVGATNRGAQTVPLKEIRVSAPHSMRNHVSFIRLESQHPPSSGRLVDIPPGDKVEGYMSIDEPLALGKYALVTLVAANGQSRTESIQIWPPPDGPTKEELERERLAKQSVLGPSTSLGACWLSSGVANDTNEQVTGCGTIGLRFTKGFMTHLAFDLEMVGGWTGSVTFGDQTRTATFGRAIASGLLRWGNGTVPYFRMGVGLQGLKHSSEFMMDDTGREDPDSSLQIKGTVLLGGGVDVRLAGNLIAGAVFSSLLRWDGNPQSLDFGVNLRYGWSP